MKKIYLMVIVSLCSLASFGQTFSGPATAVSGSTITLTAVGEALPVYNANTYEFTAVNQIYSSETTTSSPAVGYQNYVSGTTVSQVSSVFNASHTPTTVQVKVSNTSTLPITAKFYIHATYDTYVNGVFSQTFTDQLIPYTITINPVTTGGGTSPINDGDFIMDDNTQRIYFFFEFKMRYIPTAATLYGLWSMDLSMLRHFTTAQLANVPVGDPFTADNGFVRDKSDPLGKIYLREGSYIRWIPTLAMFNAYHFNMNTVKDVPNTGGYTVGPTITF